MDYITWIINGLYNMDYIWIIYDIWIIHGLYKWMITWIIYGLYNI